MAPDVLSGLTDNNPRDEVEEHEHESENSYNRNRRDVWMWIEFECVG
jgi:hypothetical protein